MPEFRLLYSSVAAVALNESELAALLGTSCRNNEADEITGILVHVISADDPHRAAFVQVLEGERDRVERTYERILADELHRDVQVLIAEVRPRAFSDWSMRLEQVSLPELQSIVEPEGSAGLPDVVRDLADMEYLIAQYA